MGVSSRVLKDVSVFVPFLEALLYLVLGILLRQEMARSGALPSDINVTYISANFAHSDFCLTLEFN